MEEPSEPPVTGEKVVEGGGENKKMKVLVAIDESEGSSYALCWVLDHLFTTDGDRTGGIFTLVHVRQPFQHFMVPAGPGVVYATSSLMDSVKKAQEQNSNTLLSRAFHVCKGRRVKAEILIMDGNPKDMICQAAEQIQADLVVVGSSGLSKLRRALLGSVSDYVARHANCPVLIVKPRKKNH